MQRVPCMLPKYFAERLHMLHMQCKLMGAPILLCTMLLWSSMKCFKGLKVPITLVELAQGVVMIIV